MDLNIAPPNFAPTQPVYPPLLQLLRVVTSAGDPTVSNLYSGFTQQVRTDNLQPRDRESCLILDTNQGGLKPGFYLGRIVRSADTTFTSPVYAVADCCGNQDGGGNITVINDCTLTHSPGFTTGLVINLCDNTLNFWTGYVWITWCYCFIGIGGSSGFVLPSSSSSSGGKCVPGVCSFCINPPAVWNVPVSGMTGDLAPLNGMWVLIPLDNCRWAATKTVSGNLYYASIIVGTDVVVLGFLNLTTGTTLAIYTGPGIKGGDCCQKPLPLVLSPGFGGGGSTNGNCSSCLPNATPVFWTLKTVGSINLTGFTGVFAVFNGTWTVGPNVAGCAWQAQDADLNTIVVNAFGPAGAANMQVEFIVAGNPTTGFLRYFQNAGTMTDCCIQQTLTIDSASTVGSGTGPATIQAASDCSSSGDIAPPNLTATPTCCATGGGSSSVPVGSSSTGGGGTVTVPCCPTAINTTLYATFTGSLAVLGRVPLVWDGTAWKAGVTTCTGTDPGHIAFSCNAGTNQFQLTCSFGLFFNLSAAATTCSPFLWSASGNEGILSPPCSTGPFTVTIQDT